MSDSLKKTLLAIVIIGLLAFFAIQLQAKNNLPHVVFTTLSGKKIAAADLKSKVLLVNFWATDCLSCIKEMPELVRIYNAYHAQGLELIAIAMPDDPPAQVLNYVTKKEIPFPVMHDGLSEMVEKFGGVNLTPTLFIYDKQGKLLQRSVGALDFVKLDQLLSAALIKTETLNNALD